MTREVLISLPTIWPSDQSAARFAPAYSRSKAAVTRNQSHSHGMLSHIFRARAPATMPRYRALAPPSPHCRFGQSGIGPRPSRICVRRDALQLYFRRGALESCEVGLRRIDLEGDGLRVMRLFSKSLSLFLRLLEIVYRGAYCPSGFIAFLFRGFPRVPRHGR